MQVGGVGSGHDTYSHHVTSCLHEHGANTDTGSMGAKSGAAQTAQMATEPCRRILRETCCPGYRILGIVENSSYRRSGETAKNPMMR